MDNEILEFLKNPKNMPTLVGLLLVIVAVAAIGYYLIYPKVTGIQSLMSEKQTNQERLDDLQKKKKAQEIAQKEEKEKIEKVPVIVYKSKIPDLPVENAATDYVSTVINMIEQTENDILDISYSTDAITASEKSSVPANVTVVQLVMTLNGTYASIQNFIFNLYSSEYISTIKSIKMTPLQENKNVLETSIIIWLYVSK